MRRLSLKSHVLVALQLIGITLSCWPVGWINRGSVGWLVVVLLGTVAGLATLGYNKIGNFSIYPEPKPHVKLVTNGPYRFVRHPMYSSLFIMMVGIAGYNWHWLNAIGVGCVVLAVSGKAVMEERFLREMFSVYDEYAAKTPRFVPWYKKAD
ncbi:hypothetical protein BTA51_02445 [Hahella sp. CCB-MM4]|uniref:methyltransferase family protein n=1 Tax=Hahella sp. (strain CCB-MM4) TaxID=1926491 RepID=UPI000B9A1F0E|nr:isoprenylcysteine carboxylmethyltransferase family protein [Hahella sp. CCB-MM4]OZG75264.1 hypothetical protein BTA51_02445 [Hahella sp. CCB-MM4]